MQAPDMMLPHKDLVADWQTLMRVFIRPENEATKAILLKYMEQILFGLHDFLRKHVGVTQAISLEDLACRFTETIIRPTPEKKLEEVIADLIEEIAPWAVNVASPYFVGHMTSAIPFFMVHLKTIVAALNQNVVKLETSKVVSVVEKQVLGKLHRLIYHRQPDFYENHVQNTDTTLGAFVEDGTLANLTALWVARNRALAPKAGFDGVEAQGMQAAYRAYGIERAVVLISGMAHYSMYKSGGVLGIGNRNIIPIAVDENFRMRPEALAQAIRDLSAPEAKTKILAVVGIAGTTETGSVDPLATIADICADHGIHFHVDAAWGGPVLMSERYRHLLGGIDRADSVSIDGHKQFYMPMSCGMVYFRDPRIMDAIEYHASYINRPGSVDLGIKSLCGSREATSLILDSTFKIMGSRGLALLIEHGIDSARRFADMIARHPDFEVVSSPELNILTYRYCPRSLQRELAAADTRRRSKICARLNVLNRRLQRLQREAGKSFVSRTTLYRDRPAGDEMVVLRAVIMNPMTTLEVLAEILAEQEVIGRRLQADS